MEDTEALMYMLSLLKIYAQLNIDSLKNKVHNFNFLWNTLDHSHASDFDLFIIGELT